MWLRAPRVSREGPPLSQARIVEEAVKLLDEQGIDGLTMRRLAERLGSGVTTLYWHVDTKDDVVDLALDAIFAQLPPPDADQAPDAGREPTPSRIPDPDHWREAIADLLHDWRAAMLRHPWSAALLQRPTLGPNLLARMEFLQATLVAAGLTGSRLTAATWTLYNYVMGATVARASHDLSDEDRAAAQQRLHDQSDRYPTLSAHEYMLKDDWEAAFTTGLTYVLNGIAADADPRAGT